MTAIVTFDLLKKGETSLDEMITISEKAWRLVTKWIFINVYYVE